MRLTVDKLKVGEQVVAEVAEAFATGDLLVNFRGDLVRVTNRTLRRFFVGDKIKLRVTAIQPLAFQLVNSGRPGTALDISV